MSNARIVHFFKLQRSAKLHWISVERRLQTQPGTKRDMGWNERSLKRSTFLITFRNCLMDQLPKLRQAVTIVNKYIYKFDELIVCFDI